MIRTFWISLLAVLAAGLSASVSPVWALSGIQELTEWKPTINNGYGEAKAATDAHPNLEVTRYQMAATLSNLLQKVEGDLSALEARKANKEEVTAEIAALKSIQGNVREDLAKLSQITVRNSEKNNEQDSRLGLLERVQIHGDMTVGAIADLSNNGANGRDQIADAISSVARLRLTVDVPVVEAESDTSLVGNGSISTRLIAAVGRYGPAGSNAAGTQGASTNYPFNLYTRVAGDVSAFNEGFGTGAAGKLNGQNGLTSMTRANMYMESAYYKQNFRSALPFIQVGSQEKNYETQSDLYVGIVRWWDLFDVSPYRGDEMSQFQNNAFINIPGIAINSAQPMVAYSLRQGLGENLSAQFNTALGSIDVGDFANGLNLTYEGKLNYIPAFLPEAMQKPGSLYAGAYHVFMAGDRNFNAIIQKNSSYTTRAGGTFNLNFAKQTVNAFYAGWNQEWYKGIGTNVSFLLNSDSPSTILLTTQQPGPANVAVGARAAISSVLSVPVSALFGDEVRPKDTIGLGYSAVALRDGGKDLASLSGEGLEHVVETYYKWQVNDSFSVIPSVQFIGNALGLTQNGVITALGCRLNYKF